MAAYERIWSVDLPCWGAVIRVEKRRYNGSHSKPIYEAALDNGQSTRLHWSDATPEMIAEAKRVARRA